MYRRRQNKTIQQPEEKKVIKEEPQIKAIVTPKQGGSNGIPYSCPMINVLRDINYFKDPNPETIDESHPKLCNPVAFQEMVNILLSQGYLNMKISEYWKSGESWGASYTDTTDYKRSTFLPGDVIYTKSDYLTVALLIDKVYSTFYGNGDKNNKVDSTLPINPPGSEIETVLDTLVLSTFTATNGSVFSFAKGVQFKDLTNAKDGKNLVSKYNNENGTYRQLIPTNISEFKGYSGQGDIPQYSLNKKDGNGLPDEYPKNESSWPIELEDSETTIKDHYNLSSGVFVEGWLIYMRKDATESSKSDYSSNAENYITADVIKSGPILITKVGETLCLDSVFKIPFVKEPTTQGEQRTKKSFNYSGNVTKFASEPLNSDHYQLNYGDTVGSNTIQIDTSRIYSLTAVINHKPQQTPDTPETPVDPETP